MYVSVNVSVNKTWGIVAIGMLHTPKIPPTKHKTRIPKIIIIIIKSKGLKYKTKQERKENEKP